VRFVAEGLKLITEHTEVETLTWRRLSPVGEGQTSSSGSASPINVKLPAPSCTSCAGFSSLPVLSTTSAVASKPLVWSDTSAIAPGDPIAACTSRTGGVCIVSVTAHWNEFLPRQQAPSIHIKAHQQRHLDPAIRVTGLLTRLRFSVCTGRAHW
jgi:hypothetical protein